MCVFFLSAEYSFGTMPIHFQSPPKLKPPDHMAAQVDKRRY